MAGTMACAQNKLKPMSLEKYTWKNRVLLVFAPNADNNAYQKQKSLIAGNPNGLADRDMVLLEVLADDKVYENGELQPGQTGQQLRAKYNVPTSSFTVLLIGKDGTEKHRKTEAVPMSEIFGLVDQMPMRRQEMRDQ